MGRKIKWLTFILVGLFLFGACSTNEVDQPADSVHFDIAEETEHITEEQGFRSPEEAVVAYLEGLRELDFGQMINAFSVEAHVENFD